MNTAIPALLVLCCFTACGGGARRVSHGDQTTMSVQWRSSLLRDHTLVGRIWNVNQGEFMTPLALSSMAIATRFVLIGERHDNEDHHQIQAILVRAIASSGRRPAVAFEMIDTDHQNALDELDWTATDADALARAVQWSEAWGHFEHYRPIVEAALNGGLRIAAANFPFERTRRLVREGLESLDEEMTVQLGLQRALPEELHSALIEELRLAHCGHPMPQAVLDGMVLAQRARDAMMAIRLRQTAIESNQGAVLIAGNGHVLAERGVPRELVRLGIPRDDVIAIGLFEVSDGLENPAEYAENRASLPYDIVVFTPVASREDPCESFRRHMEQRQAEKDPH